MATGSPEDNELHGQVSFATKVLFTWLTPKQEEGVFQACEDGIRDSRTESGGASAAWAKCAAVVKSHSDEMVKRWKDEIDTLLVYVSIYRYVSTAPYPLIQHSVCRLVSSPESSQRLTSNHTPYFSRPRQMHPWQSSLKYLTN